jgi:drug/metabolite transporter (DMT)-like permease
MRTAADRARTRTSVRMIVGAVLALAVGLILLNRTYLDPYDSVTGQLVLLVIAAMFALSTLWLAAIAKGKPSPRFLARLETTDAEPTDQVGSLS